MAMTGSSYPSARSTGRCAASGKAFTEGEAFVATLAEREGHPGLERLDFSTAAWESGQRPQPPFSLFGFWKGRYQAGETKKQPLLGDAELLDLFEELGSATNPKQIAFRYLLALLLVRRRILRVVSTKAGWMMVLPRGGSGGGEAVREPIAVADPGLDDQAIADAIEQLGQVVATDAPASQSTEQLGEPKPSQGTPAS
jgi:hypothetical protein